MNTNPTLQDRAVKATAFLLTRKSIAISATEYVSCIGTGILTYGHPADSTAMRLLLPERQTLHLGVAGLGGDGAMLVAIAAARYRPLAQRGVA